MYKKYAIYAKKSFLWIKMIKKNEDYLHTQQVWNAFKIKKSR